jgi:patatin-like phospholipase/acyl hydrolase
MSYTRILSIDGGGIRGIIPGQVLVALERKIVEKTGNKDARLSDYFDLIAGTSTGGILTCAYLCPDKESGRPKFSAQQVLNLYLQKGGLIFKQNAFKQLITLWGLLDEKYRATGLEKTLKEYFGDIQLSQLLKPSLITAYEITHRKAFFFTSHDAGTRSADFYLTDVARATSAAPTYFEASRVLSMDMEILSLVDGGVFANNPTLCAYAEARKYFQRPDSDKNVTAKDMVILSLGTGSQKRRYNHYKAKNWGMAGWVKPLFNIMMSGVSETVDYQLQKLFDAADAANQYFRIDPEIPKNVDDKLDSVGPRNLKALQKLGTETAGRYDERLEQVTELILEENPVKSSEKNTAQ